MSSYIVPQVFDYHGSKIHVAVDANHKPWLVLDALKPVLGYGEFPPLLQGIVNRSKTSITIKSQTGSHQFDCVSTIVFIRLCNLLNKNDERLAEHVLEVIIPAAVATDMHRVFADGIQDSIDATEQQIVDYPTYDPTELINVDKLAKILAVFGHQIGEWDLFKHLRKHNYLCDGMNNWNKPCEGTDELFAISNLRGRLDRDTGKKKFTPVIKAHGVLHFIELFCNQSVSIEDVVERMRGNW